MFSRPQKRLLQRTFRRNFSVQSSLQAVFFIAIYMYLIYHKTLLLLKFHCRAVGHDLSGPLSYRCRRKSGTDSSPFRILFFRFPVFFSVFYTFCQQILDLSIHGTEIILRPLGNLIPKRDRQSQRHLLFCLFFSFAFIFLFQNVSPPYL